MKLNLFFLCVAAPGAFMLASCGLIDGGSGGTQLKNPTVEQMAQLEKEWGVKPREVRPRGLPSAGETESLGAPPRSAAPQVVTPDPVPLPQTQTAAPPVFEQAPQAATPAQIQRLKN